MVLIPMKNTASGYIGLAGLLFLILFFLFSLPLPAQEAFQYQIKKGDTLYSISRQFKVPLDALLKANEITDPSKVRVGTLLRIPDLYVVQKGDTLYGIARKHEIKVELLLSLNNLSPQALIKPGDTLYVPKPLENAKSPETPQVVLSTREKPFSTPTNETVTKQRSTDSHAMKDLSSTPPTNPGLVGSKEKVPSKENPVKQDPAQTKNTFWPHPGTRKELTGKLAGISFQGKAGDPVYSVSSGKVAWVGPYRGFGKVVIVQSDQGYLYVYAGNETTSVEPGDLVTKGQRIGTLGINPYNQTPNLYFLVYKDGKPVRPDEAPRI